MNIEIEIKKGRICIYLKKGGLVIRKKNFSEEQDLSEKLLPAIDVLLKENGLVPQDIEKIELDADLDDSYTTYRIAKAVSEAFNWAVKRP